MAIGERIRFFRKRMGWKQKELGEKLGFTLKTSEVRMTQYESGARTPKDDMINQLAYFFDVSPAALKVPDIDSYIGLMHTFFALEDIYGLTVDEVDGVTCIRPSKENAKEFIKLGELLSAWKEQATLLRSGDITKDDYDAWRYRYPEKDTRNIWAKVPSKELSDALLEGLKEED